MMPIRVLVVDDSLMFRKLLVRALNADPNIEVVADVEDVYEARDAILKFKPDVMTLDVEMPKMNGIEFLRRLMPQYPLPVVMISSLNGKVFDALEAGAVDFINKPTNLNQAQLNDFLSQELATKVKIASTAKVGKLKRVDNTSIMGHISAAGGKIESSRSVRLRAAPRPFSRWSNALREIYRVLLSYSICRPVLQRCMRNV